MTAHSGGNHWVGRVALREPPPPPALPLHMVLPRSRQASARQEQLAAVEANIRRKLSRAVIASSSARSWRKRRAMSAYAARLQTILEEIA